MFVADYHVHTTDSPDAYNTVGDIAAAALKAGLGEIAITDHCEYKEYYNGGDFIRVSNSIPLRGADGGVVFPPAGDKVAVLRGIELGQPHNNTEKAEKIINSADFDVVLASIHVIRGMPDFASIDYRSNDPEKLLKQYRQELLELIKWGQFDVLAHLTYPLRYIRGVWGYDAGFNNIQGFRQIFREMIKRGIALEINTSGMRNDLKDYMPGMEFTELYLDCGGKLITVGSDAHFPEHAGYYIKEAYDALRSIGVEHIAAYRGRDIILKRF